jgi:energy-coupling factor transporter ATP-binding protein EcfA2
MIAVRELDLDLDAGEVVACMGRNGSGKSSLCWALQGSGARAAGTIDVCGADPAALAPAARRRTVALVPQTPGDLLYHPTVAAECEQTDAETGSPVGATRALLDRLLPGVPDDAHPHDLSEGQRLGLVLAVQLVASPRVVLLDEPTRGLDYPTKDRLAAIVRELAAAEHAVVIATHDVEFVASVADRVIVLADGEIVADGATADVVCASPAFAPQVAKILAPAPWLTVAEVRDALGATAETPV